MFGIELTEGEKGQVIRNIVSLISSLGIAREVLKAIVKNHVSTNELKEIILSADD